MKTDPLNALINYRAQLKNKVRDFFAERNVTEIDAPALQPFAVTDLHIDCLNVDLAGVPHYLQSSPEYFMKRLLCAGAGDIYSLAYAYRDGEKGRRHNPEFLMLEWYRLGWDEQRLMLEVTDLLSFLGLAFSEVQTLDYGNFFEIHTGLNPHRCETGELQAYAGEIAAADFSDELRSICLDMIFSLKLEALLPEGLVFVHNFPACQSALATVAEQESGYPVARRFEAFIDGMEIANGYHELTDTEALRQRFEQDNKLRQQAGKPEMAIDERLLSAMEKGMPTCAGVALGLDRVLMSLLGCERIEQVMPGGYL